MKPETLKKLKEVIASGKYTFKADKIINNYTGKEIYVRERYNSVYLFYQGIKIGTTLNICYAAAEGRLEGYTEEELKKIVCRMRKSEDGRRRKLQVITQRRLIAENFKRSNILEEEREEIIMEYILNGGKTAIIAAEHECSERTVQTIVSEYRKTAIEQRKKIDFIDKQLLQTEAETRRYARKTKIEFYRYNLRLIENSGKNLKEVTEKDIAEYIEKEKERLQMPTMPRVIRAVLSMQKLMKGGIFIEKAKKKIERVMKGM